MSEMAGLIPILPASAPYPRTLIILSTVPGPVLGWDPEIEKVAWETDLWWGPLGTPCSLTAVQVSLTLSWILSHVEMCYNLNHIKWFMFLCWGSCVWWSIETLEPNCLGSNASFLPIRDITMCNGLYLLLPQFPHLSICIWELLGCFSLW